ncbi:helix-turn-helix domain-containing protein, partial [Agrococcus sp. DT81.2]|uniref:helix-turn-helix domain-containing protein n=1 Tax=Agrococcus sp. DT81.2 TaxID=3393414 RepID=UPI003CE50CA0
MEVAGAAVRVSRKTAYRWFSDAGGVKPKRQQQRPDGRRCAYARLSALERDEIMVGIAAGETQASIAARLGRNPGTISREIARNSAAGGRYRASSADWRARERKHRPKRGKLARSARLREAVQAGGCQMVCVSGWVAVRRRTDCDHDEAE